MLVKLLCWYMFVMCFVRENNHSLYCCYSTSMSLQSAFLTFCGLYLALFCKALNTISQTHTKTQALLLLDGLRSTKKSLFFLRSSCNMGLCSLTVNENTVFC